MTMSAWLPGAAELLCCKFQASCLFKNYCFSVFRDGVIYSFVQLAPWCAYHVVHTYSFWFVLCGVPSAVVRMHQVFPGFINVVLLLINVALLCSLEHIQRVDSKHPCFGEAVQWSAVAHLVAAPW
jgi:hypothetical protein